MDTTENTLDIEKLRRETFQLWRKHSLRSDTQIWEMVDRAISRGISENGKIIVLLPDFNDDWRG